MVMKYKNAVSSTDFMWFRLNQINKLFVSAF